jgi:hypothetical protein
MYRLAKIIPKALRRRLKVFLIDHGFPTKKKRGMRGIEQLGHRGYVGRTEWYKAAGQRQFDFMLKHGLQPGDVLCDIGCGPLRGGRLFIEYLDRGNYVGLDGEGELVELGLRHELDPRVREDKAPEFVISYRFEFRRFSKSPMRAMAVSLFSHLNERDIRTLSPKTSPTTRRAPVSSSRPTSSRSGRGRTSRSRTPSSRSTTRASRCNAWGTMPDGRRPSGRVGIASGPADDAVYERVATDSRSRWVRRSECAATSRAPFPPPSLPASADRTACAARAAGCPRCPTPPPKPPRAPALLRGPGRAAVD